MTTDNQDGNLYPFTPPPPPPAGPSPSGRARRPRPSRLTKTAAGLVLILGAGAGAAAVASATTSGTNSNPAGASATTTPSGSANNGPSTAPVPRNRRSFGPGMPGGPMRFFGFGGLDMGIGPGGAIHASYTVKGPNGNYETIDTQYGTAADVSSGSITVKSADGFSQTYTVGSSTVVDADYNGILSVKVGDTISIQGLVNESTSTVTAERVLDVTQVQANRKSWAPGPPDGPGGPRGPGGPGGPGGPSGSGGGGGSAA
jgi:hypothetical protein